MRKVVLSVFLVVLITVPASRAAAAPILVPTFSFETPDILDQTNSLVTPAGWTFSGTNATGLVSIFDPSNGLYSNTTGLMFPLPGTADGYQYVSIDNSSGAIGGEFALTTGTLASVVDNTTYMLTVALGSSKPSNPFEFTFLELLVNGVVVGSTQIAGAQIPEDTFGDFSVSFATGVGDPLSGGQLAIRLRVTESQFFLVRFADFDNVRLDGSPGEVQPVPEPSSLLLLALAGGLGWPAIRRRALRRG